MLDQTVQELRLLGPAHEDLTPKTKNYDPSKSRKLIRTRHLVQYVASFLAGGELCGAGGRASGCGERARGVNFSVKRTTVLTEAERTRPDMTLH